MNSTWIKSHLNYANVVASIALFVVLGGGAYATIDRKITTKDLKKAAVTAPKIKGQAVKTAKLANGAVTHAKFASEATPRWAVVKGDDGSLNRARGANLGQRLGPGAYSVRFNRDVSECSYVAQMGGLTTGLPSGTLSTTRHGGDVNAIVVRTRGLDGEFDDRDFHVQVLC